MGIHDDGIKGHDDYAALADRFDSMTEARAEHQRLASRRAHLAPQLREAREEVDRLRAVHAKEAGDVDRLDRTSPTRIWASMRGGLDDRLARERAEAETARFNLERAQEILRRLEREDGSMAADQSRLGDLDEGYEATLAEVHRLAQEPGAGVLRERAAQAGQALEDLRWRRELDEALVAGHQARGALGAAKAKLGGAKAWSAYDLIGGGMLSSMIKHDQLDKATALLDDAAAAMQRFSRELADVELPGLDAPVVDELSRGLDIWFDNFVTDIMVGQRIAQADAKVSDALEAVDETLATLQRLRDNLS